MSTGKRPKTNLSVNVSIKKRSRLENIFSAKWLRDYPHLHFEREYVIPGWRAWAEEKKQLGIVTRRVPFKADFAWPQACVVVEVQGGTFVVGGHSTGPGIERDAIKSLTAQVSGWALICLTDKMLTRNGEKIWLPKLASFIVARTASKAAMREIAIKQSVENLMMQG
jgi:hypothetical protein